MLPSGKSADSSFKSVILYEGMPEHLRKEQTDLFKHYFPLERDYTLSAEKKKELMT